MNITIHTKEGVFVVNGMVELANFLYKFKSRVVHYEDGPAIYGVDQFNNLERYFIDGLEYSKENYNKALRGIKLDFLGKKD